MMNMILIFKQEGNQIISNFRMTNVKLTKFLKKNLLTAKINSNEMKTKF